VCLYCSLIKCVVCVFFFFFFFFSSRRRHTISYGDWSSDVCSSDLHRHTETLRSNDRRGTSPRGSTEVLVDDPCGDTRQREAVQRSEERRVGKECRSGWWPYD